MQDHVRLYLEFNGYDISDFIQCEICEIEKAVDVHHIKCRGMGGGNKDNSRENLMAVCRKCHIEYGDISHLKETLRDLHAKRMMQIDLHHSRKV